MMNAKPTDVILHAFDWSYETVGLRAKQIATAGYKAVLVSPPFKSLSSEQPTAWWQRYQPQDYRVIENQLGDTNHFKKMIAALNQEGVLLYVDVVFNHMANESRIRGDLQYPSDDVLAHYQEDPKKYQSLCLFGDLSQPLFTEEDFVEAFGIHDWNDPWQVQHGRITGDAHDQGLPTLAPTENVIAQQKSYLFAMKEMGVKGFRIDAAKHMTLDHLKQVWSSDVTQDVHIFGEIITDGGASAEEYELFLEPYLEHTRLGAYDFPLFQMLFNHIQKSGDLTALFDPYCFGQALSKHRAITFAITHDIPNNHVFQDLIMEPWAESLAYSYLLGRDGGVPLIYSEIASETIRPNNRSRWCDDWQHQAMCAKIEFHNRMHGLPMHLLLGETELLVFARGDQGVVVLNSAETTAMFELPWNGQCLTDLISGKQFFADDDGKMVLEIPAKESYMLVSN